MQNLSDWLYATGLSTALRETAWVVPALQSVHILAIAILIGSALVTDLRLAGVMAVDISPGTVVRAYFSRILGLLAVLLVSGSLLILIEPGRTLGNTLFWVKMGLILLALAISWFLKRPLMTQAGGGAGGGTGTLPGNTRLAGWLSLIIWVAVIFCGRWIAYT
ncbi:MAG TPA: DUF6644 family protein [Sphingomonadaceae bacterium]|nr:DUF6644 family protein [Sphingomonadaceae bacterium]